MPIAAEAVKTLRQITGAGFIECKAALEETKGDINAAAQELRKKGIAKGKALADKRGTAGLNQGLVEVYSHPGGRVGVVVEINCATDFVSRTADFKDLARNIAMQIAAMDPEFVAVEDAPEGFAGSVKDAALLEQAYIRDQSKTVKDLLAESIGKLGENIRVRRFARYVLAS